MKQSNPTEVNSDRVPAGDDAAGWIFTQQTYDWKGRPLVTTNQDGTQKYASYSACGCAGSEVATLTDERGRQQKSYSDVLGRTAKTEVLNWDSTVYSTSTNTYNARDQVTLVRQYQGADTSGVYQDTTMSYDGHGRLQSKHVPEQNSGTATTYAYNSDDTVYAVTDARGASATYSYNNRHLVTGITYSAPSGITPTSNVAFSYDAVGERTSMTDGTGGTSYQYNSVSQLTAETKQFNGLSGSYTFSYGYNLAGEVKTMTDPWGAVLNYGFDSTGRLNSVGGSGYGSVSQFAYGMQYRAWGGVKGLSYNSSRSLSMSYNSRMNVTLFQAIGQNQTIGSEYQYHPDGRISYSRDLTDGVFDRSYSYDHMARLTAGFSGSEARGGSVPDGPYNQTYGYDAFANLTQRTGRHWSHNLSPVTFTYDSTTNRNPQWQYDTEGNVITQGTLHYTFDAAGRQVSTYDASNNLTTNFDGDGLKAKRTNPGWVGYYLRSSVLDGAVVAELNPQGQMWKRYIYGNGQVLAEQLDIGQINWIHRSPNNNSQWYSASTTVARAEEYDPLGTSGGTEDPYINGGGGDFGNWTSGLGNPSDLTTGCSWEGMAIGCQYVVKLIGWRGYIAGSREFTITTNLPGAVEGKYRTSLVRSSAVPVGEKPQWSPGDIMEYKDLVPTPDSYETSIVRTHHARPQNPTKSLYQTCREQTFGSGDSFMDKGIPDEGMAYLLLAAGGTVNDSAFAASIVAKESNFTWRPTDDHGPAQLTDWWKKNQPGLIIPGAYDPFPRPDHGPNAGNRQKKFTGSPTNNIMTLGNIVRFQRKHHAGNEYMMAKTYYSGPGDQDAYAKEVLWRYDGYKSFFICMGAK